MIVIIIFVIAVVLILLAPWVAYLMEEYLDWTSDVIYEIRKKKYENKNRD